MKTIKIYSRKVLKRTGYRQFPFKEVKEVIILFDQYKFKNCDSEIDNPNLKIPFTIELETRSFVRLLKYRNTLSNKESDKYIKDIIDNYILKKES